MKCNKCLKKIPDGEEIRFSSNDSSWRGSGGGYGGCYCEDCWKKSKFYRRHEDGGKQPEPSSNSEIPSWGFFLLGVLATVAIVGLIYWLTKTDKDQEIEY